jgi:Tfp pilus assembly protein PilN
MGKPENQVIAIRSGSIEWTRLHKGRDGWELDATAREALPEGEDLLRRTAPLSPEAGTAIESSVRAMDGRHATLVLPGSSAIQRLVILPAVDPHELAGMVELQIDSLSPFPPETVAYSYDVLETRETDSRVLIAAIQKSVVEAIGGAFHQHKLQIDRITLSTLGWWDILRRRPDVVGAGRRVLLIAEKQSCELLVADSGVPVLFRSHSLIEGLTPAEFAQDIGEETASAMTSLELEHGSQSIPEIVVWMAEDAPAELPAALTAAGGWQVKTEPLDSLGPLSEGVARREVDATGVRLDLVLDAWRVEENNRLIKRRLAAASAAALGVWLLGIGAVLGWQEFHTRRLANLEAELATVKPAAQEVRDNRKRVQSLNLFGDITRSALECLREITTLMPEGVELNQITFEKGKAIALSGEAPASQAVYDFKKALDGSALFYGTELQGPIRTKNRETFRIAIALFKEAGE